MSKKNKKDVVENLKPSEVEVDVDTEVEEVKKLTEKKDFISNAAKYIEEIKILDTKGVREVALAKEKILYKLSEVHDLEYFVYVALNEKK